MDGCVSYQSNNTDNGTVEIKSSPDFITEKNSLANREEGGIKVKEAFGLVGGVSMIIGTMIGSGIFASAKSVAIYSGSVGMMLVVWAICGVIAVSGALCYVELGLMLPASGGEYIYIKEGFGNLPAFLFVFVSSIVLKPAAVSAIVLASGAYVVEPFLVYETVVENNVVIAKVVAAVFLTVIIGLNCISAKIGARVQIIFTACKLIAIVIIIGTGIVRLAQGHYRSFDNAFEGTSTRISDIGYAFYGGLWAYDGWNNLNYAVEELRNPLRNLPLSIMTGLPLVTVLYIAVIVSYLTVLTPLELSTSSAVAVTLGERMYGVMHWIMPVLVACSTFGAANGSAYSGGRLVFASARNGHMPEILAMLHKERNTPIPALIFTYVISLFMIFPESSNFEQIITYFNFVAWISYGVTFSALLWLRYKRPELKRPYRVFLGFPIFMLLCSLYLVVAPFADYPLQSFYCVLFIFSGIPIYFVFVYYKLMPQAFQDAYASFTKKIQRFANIDMPASETSFS